MELISIGRIVNTRGLKGEVKVMPDTDFKQERYFGSGKLFLRCQDEDLPVKVKSFRTYKGFDFLVFEGLEDINLVERFKGCELMAQARGIHPASANEFHVKDLIGIKVFVNGIFKGEVVAIREYPQGDYLEIASTKIPHALVPFRDEFIVNIDREEGKIDVVEMEGLL